MGVLSDFVAGNAAGVAGMVIEYPFDTVKVLMQSYPAEYSGYVDCAARVWRHDGVAGFYRGVTARLLASGIDHACVFVFYKWTLRAVGADEDRPTLAQIAAGGLGSGVASTVCLTPFELVKCRMQADEGGRRYAGAVDCARQVLRSRGARGLYQGAAPTLLREVPGTMAWCGTFDLARRALTPAGASLADLPVWKLALAGGAAGVAFWTVMFPADVVKTRIQVDPAFASSGVGGALVAVFREGGVRGLYRGWGLTAARSFPSNAVIFLVFDKCARWLRRYEPGQLRASADP